MNINVPELTDMALQIMGYKMYDRNGIPVDSLDALISEYQPEKGKTGKAKSTRRKTTNPPIQTQDQFIAQFGLPNFDTVLENPKQYVESQLTTFLQQHQERLVTMRTEDDAIKSSLKALRSGIGRQVAKDKPVLAQKMHKIYTALCQADEEELRSRTQFDVNVGDHVLLKQGILLHEFNILLQLLKRIMEDVSDNYTHYDFAFYLLQKLYEQM